MDKFQEAKNVYFDFVLEAILAMDMSYMDFGDNMGFMKDNTFNILARGDNADFVLSEKENSFIITVHNFEAEFISEYTRIRDKLITVSGHSKTVCKNVTISVEMIMYDLPSNDTNTTGRHLFGIDAGFILVEIDRDQVDFKFEGNAMANFVDWFQAMYLPYAIT